MDSQMSNSIQITKEDIAAEKHRRKKEETDELQLRFSPLQENGFWEFCKYIAPDFYFDEAHPRKELCRILQGVTNGIYRKVLISVYRRFGKSRTCSMWVAWMLIYYPDSTFMRNCYSAPLAIDLSKKTMDILGLELYQKVAPHITLDPKESSKLSWQVRGAPITTYFGTGIEGSIIGKGCKTAALLDDPIKNPEEAVNDVYMEKLELFIETVHNTCIDPGSDCAEIIISTRWTEKDPIGMRMDDPDWTVFTFMALDDNDKSTCEAIHSTDKLLKIKKSWENKGLSWMFEAMYQSKPISHLISKFSKNELKRFRKDEMPKTQPTEIVAFLDYANKGSDYLSMPIAYCWEQDRYIVDVVFSDVDSGKLKPKVIEKLLAHNFDTVVFESNQGGQEFFESIEELIGDQLESRGTEFYSQYSSTNKEIRILVRVGEIKATCWFLDDDEQSTEYKEFFNQLTNYGKLKSKHDDAPDSLAGLLGILSESNEIDISYFSKEKKQYDRKVLDINNIGEISGEEYDDDDDCDVFIA